MSVYSDDQICGNTTPTVAVQLFEQTMSHSNRVNLVLVFLPNDIPATDNISNDEPWLSDCVVPVAPMPRFPFSAAMTKHLRKIHRDLQPTTVDRLLLF